MGGAARDGRPRPGRRAPVAGTDPAFVGAADEFQLRLRGNPRALRARFVRALPTATVARRVGERLRRRARISARRQVSGPSVRVITRTEWGGDSVPPRAPADYGTVEVAFVHHTVTTNDYDPEDSAGIVLGIARYHRDSNGWNDLGYNFLVDKYGQVFEGRAGGIDAPVIGAQAQGYNSVSTGIAVLGTYTEIARPEPALDALARLIGWKLTLHGVPVQGQVTVTSAGGASNRYRSGTPVTLERISGHRDGDATSCPGDVLYGQLADLRARAARYAGPLAALTMYTSQDRPRRQAVRGRRRAALRRRLLPRGRRRSTSRSRPAARRGRYYTGAVANADGSWVTSVSLPYSANLRAVFPGDSRPRMESKAVAVKVVPSLQIALSSGAPAAPPRAAAARAR